MKRVGALVGAIVMVIVALVVRGQSVDDSSGAVDGPTDASGGDDGAALVCATDFGDLCDLVSGTTATARAGDTADQLLTDGVAALDGDSWLTTSAWVSAVEAERIRLGRAPVFDAEQVVIARSPVTLAIWADAAAELEAACGRPVDWSCIAERDGTTLTSGGRVRSGIPRVDSAFGLVVAANQAGGLLGTTDFASNDFTGSFTSSATALSARQSNDPLAAMRARGPGELTAAGIVSAAGMSERTSTFGSIIDVDLHPPTWAQIVLVSPMGVRPGSDTVDELRSAFGAAGWEPPADGDAAGLPAGGVLAAIRSLWSSTS